MKETKSKYKKYYDKNKQTLLEKRKNVKYWSLNLYLDARKRNKKRFNNLELDFNVDYINELYDKQNKKCYWYGIEFDLFDFLLKPSLDRLDNKKGYCKDNIVLCCKSANFGRNSSSVEDFNNFINKLKQNFKND